MIVIDGKLISDEGKMLKNINDNGQDITLEDGTVIHEEPYLTNIIYLGKQITTLEQAKELYEEVEIK
ncbi:MAG: hypothetical protein IKL08_01810 [Clostridia bacterium]|nr:hypothetical protein [Clostridia bacterium]